MATNVVSGTSANVNELMSEPVYFKNFDKLKETLDDIDLLNIRTQFKAAKDPIYLAFEHIDKQPLKKIAKDFVRDIKDGVVELISSIPTMFQDA